MRIHENYLTPNIYSRPEIQLRQIKGIVVHWVKNPGTSGIANRNYFENLRFQNKVYGSAHFIVGLTGEIIQCLLEHEMAYHVGATKYTDRAIKELSSYPNNCTIGIELCHPTEYDEKNNVAKDSNKWIGKFTDTVLKSTKKLVLELCGRHNLSKKNIYRHFDITGKDCPRYFVNNQNEWDQYLSNIFES